MPRLSRHAEELDVYDLIARRSKVARWKVEQLLLEHSSRGVSVHEMNKVFAARDAMDTDVEVRA